MYAFLDIETSWERTITIIGIYRSGEGTTQLIAPQVSRQRLLQALEGVEQLFTYNGTCFDLPVIEKWLGIHLARHLSHRDLLYDCRKRKLKGGLKGVERTLGIHRDTEGVNGLQAMHLWAAHQRHRSCLTEGDDLTPRDARSSGGECCEELELLLRYNKEDCENLEPLARKIGVLQIPSLVRA